MLVVPCLNSKEDYLHNERISFAIRLIKFGPFLPLS